MADDILIRLRNVDRIYQRGGEELHVLNGLDLEIRRGEFIALMGPSGSGKSTILNLIGGLDRPDDGSVEVGGEVISDLDGSALAGWRAANIGFIFQSYNLIPVLTARQNVELPLLLAPIGRKRRREQAELALRIVGLTDRMDHYPNQLSGGQEQRVAIARAIGTDPAVLLGDEPTGDLDETNANAILDLLERLNRENGQTIVMVTHDPKAAARAHRTLHLEKGRLLHQGSPA